jgi:alkyl hydroperoxide reductase subunit D
MSIEKLKNQLPDFAKDIKLNLASVLTEEGATDLNQKQIYTIALTVAYTSKNAFVIESIFEEASKILVASDVNAAKAAATIMAMNNIYYRFIHLTHDKSFSTMPAKLRMNVIGNPGIAKIDFELTCLAVSAMNGCGMCMDAHTHELIKSGVSKFAIQSAVRIASVINAVSTGVDIVSQSSSTHGKDTF